MYVSGLGSTGSAPLPFSEHHYFAAFKIISGPL